MSREKITQTSNRTEIFYFANATNRIFARFLDSLLMIFFCIGFAFLFYFFCDVKVNVITNMQKTKWWQFDAYLAFVLLINCLYFLILPYFWHGQTLFRKVFRIRLIVTDNKYKFGKFILHDLFIWIILFFFFFLISLILTFTESESASNVIIKLLIRAKSQNLAAQIIGWFFWIIIVVLSFILLFIFVNTMINSQTQTFCDLKSKTAMIKTELKSLHQNNSKLQNVTKYPSELKDLPGIISTTCIIGS